MLFPDKPLPEEVTELILLCLPFPVLRETVPFVCKSWAECVQVSRGGRNWLTITKCFGIWKVLPYHLYFLLDHLRMPRSGGDTSDDRGARTTRTLSAPSYSHQTSGWPPGVSSPTSTTPTLSIGIWGVQYLV